jgi:hypothetical protein
MTNDHAATTGTTRRHLLQFLGLAGAAGATIAAPTVAFAKPKHKQKGWSSTGSRRAARRAARRCARHHKRLRFLTHAIANATPGASRVQLSDHDAAAAAEDVQALVREERVRRRGPRRTDRRA